MTIARHGPKSPRPVQQGFALSMVVFMTTTLLVLAALAAPTMTTEGHRDTEKGMTWRGRQQTGTHSAHASVYRPDSSLLQKQIFRLAYDAELLRRREAGSVRSEP